MRANPDNLLWKSIKAYEKEFIEASLRHHGWNVVQTAKFLGIDDNNLRAKLRKFSIKRPQT